MARSNLDQCQRIVVKIGSSTLTHPNGRLHLGRLEQLVREIVDIIHEGRQVAVVSSGAVAAGLGRMQMQQPVENLAAKQALAAIGQGILMQAYEKLFSEYGVVVAQILLTSRTLQDEDGYMNTVNTLRQLLEWQVLPIINENDTVATDEIRFGDNDTLAAHVVELMRADLLIMLTETDGVYTSDPHKDPTARKIETIEELTPDLMNLAANSHSPFGTGGMATKLTAAQIACRHGARTVIAPGHQRGILRGILAGESVGTIIGSAGR